MMPILPAVRPDAEHPERFWWRHYCDNWTGGKEPIEVTLPIGGPTGWTYDPTEDTVTPSIHCMHCGLHGWWSRGKWVHA